CNICLTSCVNFIYILAASLCIASIQVIDSHGLLDFSVWWPLFMLIFYIIAPVPLLLAKNCQNSSSSEDLSVFLTTVIVTSAYALPILFARAPKNNPLIFWGACGLTLSANTLMFATIFFLVYLVVKPDDFGIGF
ncbi:Leptin receptor gene-related protein, partial [Schistosoma japonicum]